MWERCQPSAPDGPSREPLPAVHQQHDAARALRRVCCRYLIPGGSAGHFQREGYTFDVGSSMMFGLGHQGTTNLITRALAAVGKSVETAPDPTQIHYHLPKSAAHPQARPACCWAGGDVRRCCMCSSTHPWPGMLSATERQLQPQQTWFIGDH